MEVLDIANDFTGPLIDDTFPDPERLVEYDNGIKHSGRHRFRHLTAALVLFCAGILTVGFLSCGRMATTHVADGSLTFRPFSDVKAPFDEWTRDDFLQEYEAFRHLHHRGPGRFDTFVSNLRLIDAHNRRPDVRYTLSPNQFTDLTVQEWSREYLDSSPRYEDDVLAERDGSRTLWNLASASNATLPSSINWIEKGCVTPVKDQSHCGSCWAFSSTGAIEGALCAQTGTLLNLSEQQLMDCSTDEGTHGCNGGFMDNAFRYVMKDGGLCSESEYPYQAKQGECHTQTCRRLATIEDIYDVPPRNPKAMKAAIVLHGPVAAAVEADKTSFQFYHHGILDLDCGKKLNHAILVVGYGTALNPMTQMNETYWLVKNSWGPSWGDEGYIRLGMKHHGKAGECGVLLAPTVPIVSQKDILS